MNRERIPVILLTGFLGGGKTTLLLDTDDDAPLVVQVVGDGIFPEIRLATPPEGSPHYSVTFIAVGLDPELIAAALAPFAIELVDRV
jgi:hypothetical protein